MNAAYYPHVPTDKVWIYRLLFVVFVCTVTDFYGQDNASSVKFCRVVQGHPGQGISYFGELCSPRSPKSDESLCSGEYCRYTPAHHPWPFFSDIAIFVLKRDVKLPTNYLTFNLDIYADTSRHCQDEGHRRKMSSATAGVADCLKSRSELETTDN